MSVHFSNIDYTNKYINTSGKALEKNFLTTLIVKITKLLGMKIFDRIAVTQEFVKGWDTLSNVNFASLKDRLTGNDQVRDISEPVSSSCKQVEKIFNGYIRPRQTHQNDNYPSLSSQVGVKTQAAKDIKDWGWVLNLRK